MIYIIFCKLKLNHTTRAPVPTYDLNKLTCLTEHLV